MSVSIHDPEYSEMRKDFEKFLVSYIAIPHLPDMFYDVMVDRLFSIMNDHGAVSFT